MEEKILLFIPAYNCEKQIIRVLNQLTPEVMKYITQVIVVNNRSTDNTPKVVEEFMEQHKQMPIALLKNNENYGLGGSHKVAFQYAKAHGFSYVIVFHGDDQASISDVLPILESKEYKNYDCYLGARFQKGSKIQGYSGFRTFGNRVYDLLFSIVVGRKIYDLGSGLNLYDVKMLENDFYIKFPDNLTFNYCMILASNYYKHNIKFFPITWREEDQVSNVKLFSQGMNVLGMLFHYFFHKKYILQELRTSPKEEYSAEVIAENVEE